MKPNGLSQRSEQLWDGVLEKSELDPAGLRILEDACRTVDIIDRLTGALKSKHQEWIRLADEIAVIANTTEIHLVINPLLGEIRQQRMALRSLLAQLKLGTASPKSEADQHKSILEQLEEEFNGN